jgi:hypothetical protein
MIEPRSGSLRAILPVDADLVRILHRTAHAAGGAAPT